MADQKFKSKVRLQGGLKIDTATAERALYIDASGDVQSSTVTQTELESLSGISGDIQTQIDSKADQADLDAHIDDLAGAHAASAISVTPAGNLAADDVQEALEELQTDVDSRIASAEKGAANGVATLDAGGKVPVAQLPNSVMEFQGAYDADTNTPTLVDGTGNAGDVYRVSVAGTPTGFTDPSMSEELKIGDFVIYSGTVWQKAPASDAVLSVFGRQGIVTAQSGDYSASQITNTPAGNIASTDVQAAINELDSEKFASADFDSTFDTRLATKTTDDLTEGTINKYFSDEAAQDAVGSILVDSSSIDFTYNDGTPEITAVVLPAGVDHDQLQNFVANEHVDHSAVEIQTAANSGLSGGGDITATRSLVVDITGTTLETSVDNADEILIYDVSASARRKTTVGDLLNGIALGSEGDIPETSFAMANDVSTPANVTGFVFSNTVVRSFRALVSIEIDADTDAFEMYDIIGINKGGSFEISQSSVGDESGVVFSITAGGQIQYTSANSAGFVSGSIKFRAETTSV